MNDSVLVTGGSGFIGTWVLRELLSRGLQPVAFDLQRNTDRWQRVMGDTATDVSFVAGSLLDRELLQRTAREQRVSHIIHLAALLTPQCQQDPFAGCEINVLGGVALFELARACAGQIKGISYASSYAVYGPEADDGPLGETPGDNDPPTFYGAYKLAVDLIAQQYWRHYAIASVGIRPHVVYGPERTQGLTAGPSLAARAVAKSEPFTISYTGCVGYDYVEDVARAFVQAGAQSATRLDDCRSAEPAGHYGGIRPRDRPSCSRCLLVHHGQRSSHSLQHTSPPPLHLSVVSRLESHDARRGNPEDD